MMTELATSPSSLVDSGEHCNVAAPASPTASLWDEASAAAESRAVVSSPRKSKRVVFSEEVKAHDGLTRRCAIFDELVTLYFVDQQEVSELDVLRIAGNDLTNIVHLHEDLLDMSARIQDAVNDGRQCAPVLPRGGGMCTKLCPPHVVYIQVLDRVVEAAGNRVDRALAMSQLSPPTSEEGDVVMA